MPSANATGASCEHKPAVKRTLSPEQLALKHAIQDFWMNRLRGNRAQLLKRIAEQTFLYLPNGGRAERQTDLPYMLAGKWDNGVTLDIRIRTAYRASRDLQDWGLVTQRDVLIPSIGFRPVYGVNVQRIIERDDSLIPKRVSHPVALTAKMAKRSLPNWQGGDCRNGRINSQSTTPEPETPNTIHLKRSPSACALPFSEEAEPITFSTELDPTAQKSRAPENLVRAVSTTASANAREEQWVEERGCMIGPLTEVPWDVDAEEIAERWGFLLRGRDHALCQFLASELIDGCRYRFQPDTLAQRLAALAPRQFDCANGWSPALLMHIARELRNEHGLVHIDRDGLLSLNLDRWLNAPKLPGIDYTPEPFPWEYSEDPEHVEAADALIDEACARWEELWGPALNEDTDEYIIAGALIYHEAVYRWGLRRGEPGDGRHAVTLDEIRALTDLATHRIRDTAKNLADLYPGVFTYCADVRYPYLVLDANAWQAGAPVAQTRAA